MIALTKFICSQVQFGNTKRLHLQIKVSLRLFYFLQIVNSQSILGLVLSLGGVLPIVLFDKESRVFLEISLVVVNHRPFKWLRDIFLGREICSQSRGISFSKINKIENC